MRPPLTKPRIFFRLGQWHVQFPSPADSHLLTACWKASRFAAVQNRKLNNEHNQFDLAA